MKKEYESSMEEAVEVQYRIAEFLGTVRKLKWIGLLAIPVSFLTSFLLLDNLAQRLVCGAVASGLYILYHLSTYRQRYRKRIRKILVKMLGTDHAIPSEYEINESGLIFRRLGHEVRFSWDNVQSINRTEDSIELLMSPAAIAIIPKRIFENPAEWQEWIEFIEGKVGTATY
ncbi:MAG: YcxB family protein [Sedimentisphaerales bacterium]|jgi:hypothetical protein